MDKKQQTNSKIQEILNMQKLHLVYYVDKCI